MVIIMSNNNHSFNVVAAFFVAIGLAVAGYFISQTIYNSKVALNTAESKGLAERRVLSDRANWSIDFSEVGSSRGQVTSLYNLAEEHQNIIVKLLKDNGFGDDEIKIGVINYNYREYRDDNQKLVDQKHILVGTISVETEKVNKIAEVRGKVNKLIVQGINLENHQPQYYFTKLNEIKPEMLSEATKNARAAANEFAKNADVEVGGIRTALQGGFYIRDAGEEYGDSRKIEKDIRVVTTITFYLTE
jgi:uncharacterized protein